MCHFEDLADIPAVLTPPGSSGTVELIPLTPGELAATCLALEVQATALGNQGQSGSMLRSIANRLGASGGVFFVRRGRAPRREPVSARGGDTLVSAGVAERELGIGSGDLTHAERDGAAAPERGFCPVTIAGRALGCLLDLKDGRVWTRADVAALRVEVDNCIAWMSRVRPNDELPVRDAMVEAEHVLRMVVNGQLGMHDWGTIIADKKLLAAGIIPAMAQGEPLAKLGQGDYTREIPGRDAVGRAPERHEVEVICSACGAKTTCPERVAQGEARILCDRCEANGVEP